MQHAYFVHSKHLEKSGLEILELNVDFEAAHRHIENIPLMTQMPNLSCLVNPYTNYGKNEVILHKLMYLRRCMGLLC